MELARKAINESGASDKCDDTSQWEDNQGESEAIKDWKSDEGRWRGMKRLEKRGANRSKGKTSENNR